ncbi:leucine-rich repeat domain-containing protein [Streptomyces sp. PRKS01-29]|nr:leucine-rich repeat domain-containing protein [Streptomyces sabulosicollis]MBI0296216.1 leucine-rich repeat domain-containing protein [Streptomyces sabulosicollis]
MEAVAREVGHRGPFSAEDLASLNELHVRNARSLKGIQYCSSLEILIIVGCDPVDIRDLMDISGLRSLTIRDSGLMDLQGVTELSLRSFTVPRNFLSDVSSLLSCSRLQSADLTGNPLTEDSYFRVIPELRKKLRRVRSSDELEWRVTAHLHRCGVFVSCYKDDRGYRLCRPGMGLTGSPEFAHPVITEDGAQSLLRDAQKAYEYFDGNDFLTPTD